MGERPRLVAALGAEARGFFPPTNGLGNCKRPPVGGELLGREGGHLSSDQRPWKLYREIFAGGAAAFPPAAAL